MLLCVDALVGEDVGGAALRQRLDKVDVIDALVEAAVGVAAVVGELVGVVEEQVLVVARHAERRVALGVDVVEDRAERLPDGQRRHRLGGDHDQLARLALFFVPDDGVDVGVGYAEIGAEVTCCVETFAVISSFDTAIFWK
jgi:hypothetical protein